MHIAEERPSTPCRAHTHALRQPILAKMWVVGGDDGSPHNLGGPQVPLATRNVRISRMQAKSKPGLGAASWHHSVWSVLSEWHQQRGIGAASAYHMMSPYSGPQMTGQCCRHGPDVGAHAMVCAAALCIAAQASHYGPDQPRLTPRQHQFTHLPPCNHHCAT